MKTILVTGGAGYIGSHVARMLAAHGYGPLVYDNLSTGFMELVKGHEFIRGDIGDYEALMRLFASREIHCVMNFASYIAVGESVAAPLRYYLNNTANAMTLLSAMNDSGVRRFIFSSTAAVYGFPKTVPIREESPTVPINPYGRTKYFIEQVLADMDAAYGFRSISLRYFNAAGADPSGEIGEMHMPETHLIPLAFRPILDPGYRLCVFGDDYDTPDGTCVRDYIHVNDLAKAHILAMERLLDGGASDRFNLGNGRGFSVLDVIRSAARVTGREPSYDIAPRRPGDPPALVASSERAESVLGWKHANADIDAIVESAWRWESKKIRKGY